MSVRVLVEVKKNQIRNYCNCRLSSLSFPISANRMRTSLAMPLVKSIIILRLLRISIKETGHQSTWKDPVRTLVVASGVSSCLGVVLGVPCWFLAASRCLDRADG